MGRAEVEAAGRRLVAGVVKAEDPRLWQGQPRVIPVAPPAGRSLGRPVPGIVNGEDQARQAGGDGARARGRPQRRAQPERPIPLDPPEAPAEQGGKEPEENECRLRVGDLPPTRSFDGLRPLAVEHGPDRAVNGVVRRLADTSAAARDLGFTAETGLEEGLRELVSWWRPLRGEIAAARVGGVR